MKRSLKSLVIAAVMVLAAAGTARANTINVSFLGATDVGGGEYLWEYDLFLSSGLLDADASASSSEFLTIYDIQGYVSGSASASGAVNPTYWSATTSLLGPVPTGVSLTDAATLINVTFNYTSTTPTVSTGPSVYLGVFSFRSTIGVGALGTYGSQDLDPTFKTAQGNKSGTTVPLPDGGTTAALLGAALLGFGLLRRKLA